jgi:DNA helicase-2/ATP-dependent DNA helicase PcrA
LGELSGLIAVNTQSLTSDEREVSSLSPTDWQALGFGQPDLDSLKVVFDLYESYLQGNFDTTLEIVFAVIDKLTLLSETDDPSIYYNVCKLTQIVRDFDEIEQTRRVHRLCAYFSVYASGSFDEATPLDAEVDALQVLTVHQAKGLEFRAVFMPMLVERRFPLSRTSERWLLDNDLFDAARYSTGLDDERRLFYVGATRPRDYLFITCAHEIGLKKPVAPSIFFGGVSSAITGLTDSPVVEERESSSPRTEMPLVTSYSSLEYYLTCPYRYLLLKQYGLASPPNPFFSVGRAVHLVARLIHEQGKAGIELSEEEIEQLFHEHLHLTGSQLPPYVMKRRIAAVVRALKSYAHEKKEWISRTVNVELPFDYAIPGAVVRGRIDLLVQSQDTGAVEIIDWKTGQPHDYLRTDFQMQIYALAAQEQLGLNVSKATLHYIEHDIDVEAPVDDPFINEGRSNLSSVVKGIRDKQFDPTPGSVCTRCECRPICRYRAK